MCPPLDYAIPLQKLLGAIEARQTVPDTEARKLPHNDPREPYQGSYIPKPDGPERLSILQHLETRILTPLPDNRQILSGERQRRNGVQQQLHQLPIFAVYGPLPNL